MAKEFDIQFNPYDLNDIADLDKFIKEWEEQKLRKLTHVPHKRPTKGILKSGDPRRKVPRTQTRPQS